MHFVRFHPEVTSCLLSRGKTKYATLGMRLWCKYIRNYLLVYQLTSHFLQYLQNYKEFEGEISDLQLEKYELSFETKKYTTSIWARGDENVIGIRAFNIFRILIRTEIVGSNFRFLTLPSPGIKKLRRKSFIRPHKAAAGRRLAPALRSKAGHRICSRSHEECVLTWLACCDRPHDYSFLVTMGANGVLRLFIDIKALTSHAHFKVDWPTWGINNNWLLH